MQGFDLRGVEGSCGIASASGSMRFEKASCWLCIIYALEGIGWMIPMIVLCSTHDT